MRKRPKPHPTFLTTHTTTDNPHLPTMPRANRQRSNYRNHPATRPQEGARARHPTPQFIKERRVVNYDHLPCPLYSLNNLHDSRCPSRSSPSRSTPSPTLTASSMRRSPPAPTTAAGRLRLRRGIAPLLLRGPCVPGKLRRFTRPELVDADSRRQDGPARGPGQEPRDGDV